MIVIYISLVIILALGLVKIFLYLREQISTMGPGQQKVIPILLFVIILNLVIMCVSILVNNYMNQYRLVGETGIAGDDGPQGDVGSAICSSTITNEDEC
jgi:hypothetical protein